MVDVDGVPDKIYFPGFYQLFFYGEFKKELTAYCDLFEMQSRII